MTDVELTAARVRHLAHRGQLPETAQIKRIQYAYWRRRTRRTA